MLWGDGACGSEITTSQPAEHLSGAIIEKAQERGNNVNCPGCLSPLFISDKRGIKFRIKGFGLFTTKEKGASVTFPVLMQSEPMAEFKTNQTLRLKFFKKGGHGFEGVAQVIGDKKEEKYMDIRLICEDEVPGTVVPYPEIAKYFTQGVLQDVDFNSLTHYPNIESFRGYKDPEEGETQGKRYRWRISLSTFYSDSLLPYSPLEVELPIKFPMVGRYIYRGKIDLKLLEEIIFGANIIPMDFDYIDPSTDQPLSRDLKLTCHIPLEREEPRTPQIILGKLQEFFMRHMYAPAEKNSEVVSYKRFRPISFIEFSEAPKKAPKGALKVDREEDPYELT